MIDKAIDRIAKYDIESLISAKVSERRTLDYKQQLPCGSSEDKREFLYDVSSFANSGGGDLVFGIADEKDAGGKATGLPAAANGIAAANISAEIARLESLVKDGINERIQGIQWQPVEGFPVGPVLVMRIPKSLLAPHMVVFGGMARFYSRNSTGKYPMDLGEIRSAFVESIAIGDRLLAKRREAISRLMNGTAPLNAGQDAIILMQLIPLAFLDGSRALDVARRASGLLSLLKPYHASSCGGRYNFDGYLVFSVQRDSYVQVYRSGAIEAAALPFMHQPADYKNQIPSVAFEKQIIERVTSYVEAFRQLAIALPSFIAISLLRVRNYRMSSDRVQNHPIDRDTLELPEIMIEDYNTDIGRSLRPAFDALWQSCGVERSLNYDEDGSWRPHR